MVFAVGRNLLEETAKPALFMNSGEGLQNQESLTLETSRTGEVNETVEQSTPAIQAPVEAAFDTMQQQNADIVLNDKIVAQQVTVDINSVVPQATNRVKRKVASIPLDGRGDDL